MILLLGAAGYVGSAFHLLLQSNGVLCKTVSRDQVDYYDEFKLTQLIREIQPDFLINAAGYTGKPNVDSCELHKAECLLGNSILPGILREVCEAEKLPWGHVSSGCIYTGRKADGDAFTEDDAPNFSFRTDNCSFYSGSKALGEEMLKGADNCYIWRLRIPFNHMNSTRNYLSKLLNYERLLEAENSISHLDEFVAACFACWEKRVAPGIYNITNTGSITTSEVVAMIKKYLKADRHFDFYKSEAEFMALAAKTPRSNCVLDNSKLLNTGIAMSSVEDAIRKSLTNWKQP
jgi:dTDP-4-dehydrorhamnose reductase